MTPNSPGVSTTPIPVGAGDTLRTISAPWFYFRFQIVNSTKYNLYLFSFRFSGTGSKDNKTIDIKIPDITASNFETSDHTAFRTNTITTIGAGQTYTEPENVYVGGLPDENAVDNFYLSLHGTIEGYFTDPADSNNVPVSNFRKEFYFTTTYSF